MVINRSLHLQVPIEKRKKGSKKKKKELSKDNVRHCDNNQRNAKPSDELSDDDELTISNNVENVEDVQDNNDKPNDEYYEVLELAETDVFSEGEETEENQKTYKYKNLDHFVKLNNRSPEADEEGEIEDLTWGASDDEYVGSETSNTVNGPVVRDSDDEIDEDDFL